MSRKEEVQQDPRQTLKQCQSQQTRLAQTGYRVSLSPLCNRVRSSALVTEKISLDICKTTCNILCCFLYVHWIIHEYIYFCNQTVNLTPPPRKKSNLSLTGILWEYVKRIICNKKNEYRIKPEVYRRKVPYYFKENALQPIARVKLVWEVNV